MKADADTEKMKVKKSRLANIETDDNIDFSAKKLDFTQAFIMSMLKSRNVNNRAKQLKLTNLSFQNIMSMISMQKQTDRKKP